MDDYEQLRAEAQRRADAFEQLMDDVVADIQKRTQDQQKETQ